MSTEQVVKEREKKKEITRKKKLTGLCATCVKAEICTFPKVPNYPVLECDEFEGYAVPWEERVTQARKIGQYPVKEKAEDKKYKGLCRNCCKRETCTFPKPEGGVWRCDEYC